MPKFGIIQSIIKFVWCVERPKYCREFRMLNKNWVGKQLSFDATLENWADGMDYCAVSVPATITESLGTKGPVLVSARVNQTEPFQVSLFPVGGGKHYIRIKSKIRKRTDIKVGDQIKLDILVLDPDDVEIPDDLLSLLETNGLIDAFTEIPPGNRNYMIRRIQEAAKLATREKRINEALDTAAKRDLKP